MGRGLHIFAGALCVLAGCGDPCKDLSIKVCNCQPSSTERMSCIQNVGTIAGQRRPEADRTVERAGLNRCADLMSTCTCNALAAGQLDKCGLSSEPATEP